jgi:hypothetical protein
MKRVANRQRWIPKVKMVLGRNLEKEQERMVGHEPNFDHESDISRVARELGQSSVKELATGNGRTLQCLVPFLYLKYRLIVIVIT